MQQQETVVRGDLVPVVLVVLLVLVLFCHLDLITESRLKLSALVLPLRVAVNLPQVVQEGAVTGLPEAEEEEGVQEVAFL